MSENDTSSPALKYAKFPGGFVALFGLMQVAARSHGYALAIHGSMNRDLDLIAVPWSYDARDEDEMAWAVAKSIGARIPSFITVPGVEGHVANPVPKPYGRLAYVIPLTLGIYVDLSVMVRRRGPRSKVVKPRDA